MELFFNISSERSVTAVTFVPLHPGTPLGPGGPSCPGRPWETGSKTRKLHHTCNLGVFGVGILGFVSWQETLTGSPGVPGKPGSPDGPCQDEKNKTNHQNNHRRLLILIHALTDLVWNYEKCGHLLVRRGNYNLKPFRQFNPKWNKLNQTSWTKPEARRRTNRLIKTWLKRVIFSVQEGF